MGERDVRPRYLLGIDAGQTAVKAVVHDERLRPLAIARRSSPLDRPVERQAERSHEELWSAAADAISEAIRVSGVNAADIVAVGITGHGDGLHLVTSAGEPVGPAITAMDSRAHREAAELASDPEKLRTVLELSGQLPTAGAAGNLLRWLLRHDPARVRRADAMLFCKDIIRLRLTGVIATDYSDACASFLDTTTAQWSAEIIDAYGLPSDIARLLPPVYPSSAIIGSVLAGAAARTGLTAGTPVVAGMHDVQAASIGMGALVPGRLALVAGSFSTNGVTTHQSDVDPRWQSRLSITPDLRIAMSTSATASPTFDWVLRLLGVRNDVERDTLLKEAAELDPQENVPLILPFLIDSPIGAQSSGTLAGVRDWHTPAHVLRGALEGIVLMHCWHTRTLAHRFSWDESVVLGGGLSRSSLYVQLVANALRSPISVVKSAEAGAFGAALVAGVAVGVFESVAQAQDELVARAPVVRPTAESAAYWTDLVSSFDALLDALGPWWLPIRDHTRGGHGAGGSPT